SSRAAPADGAAFGGVLGQAMAEPAHPATGAGDGKADGKSDGKNNDKAKGIPTAAADAAATLAADLAPTVAGPLASSAAASGTSNGAPTATGTTGRSDKKRPTDATAANPGQMAQAASVVVASLVVPTVNGAVTVTAAGAGTGAAVGATRAIASATVGSPGGRATTGPLTVKPTSTVIKGANALTHHELVGPEDGTGSQEPDGIDPATATVGRPAAMAPASLAAALPPGAALTSAVSAANTANAPASGTSGRQPGAVTVTDAAPSAGAPASTAVLATLATVERDPNQTPPGNGGNTVAIGATGPGGPTVPAGVPAAGVPLPAPPASQTAPTAASGAVNGAAPDGTNQPLASALGSQILTMVAAGRNQVTVHLSPPDLGTLTVHVEIQSRDVSAWFASPQPQVQQAVSDALAQLHGSLSGAGLNLSGAWVGADVSGGGNGRPAATPLPARRGSAVPGRVEVSTNATTSVEGLSVYA
ncbi:MAG: flagellar hook-length control protein FliK, partial [Alphaproteobacteria bacterium]|nr:flagellar hook-length control protein FliK [Alphaproteobacteria bacterium]